MYVLHFENFKLSWLSLSRLNSEWVFICLYFLLLLSADPGRQQRGARQGTRVVPFQPQTLEIPESVQKGTNLILAQAATCGHLRPLALAATFGCKWLQVVADEKRMRAATGGHSSGCKWLQVAADEKPNAGGHWRTLAATRLALADTGGRWRPLDWLQVAASGCRWEENAGGHWRPLIGRKGVQVAADEKRMMAATGGHWRPLEWLQVAASGCQAWVKLYVSPFILSWAENIGNFGNFPFPAHCARKIYNILRGRSLGNVKYCTVLLSMLREFLWSEARPIWNVLGHVASRRCVSSNMERR